MDNSRKTNDESTLRFLTPNITVTVRNTPSPLEIQADNPVRVVIIPIFWTALFLNSLGAAVENSVQTSVLEIFATVLYAVNMIFLIMGKIPGVGALSGPGCDCGCSCMSRPYAIASTVFFAFSIGTAITSFVYLW